MRDERDTRSNDHLGLYSGGGTLVSAAATTAARWPDREAFRVDDVGITHAELDDASRRLAGWLSANGTTPGRAVLVAAPNSIGLVVAYLAVLRAGAMVNLVNPTVAERELAARVKSIRPSATLASAEMARRLDGMGVTAPNLTLGADGPEPASGMRSRPAMDDLSRAAMDDIAIGPDTIAHLAFTSGTTGQAKAVPLTHANVLASVHSVMLAWRWVSGDVLVHALPLQHAHGLTAVHLAIISGSRSVVMSRFEPQTLCEAIASHRATVVFGVPTTYHRLLGWKGFERADLSSLRLATSGSAPLPPGDSDALARVLGHRPLERYGLTEAGFVLSNLYEGERFAGAVGYPLPGIEMRIVDADETPVTDGQVGEIVVRGPQVFEGYRDAERSHTFLSGGWFRTGDLGTCSPITGAVSITGRLKELIITGGMNVYPREVELVLEAHPHVSAAAVVGRPSARWGEEVVAFVVADEDLDADELAAAVTGELAPHQRPKSYVLVEEIPRNHMGKILRSELSALLVDTGEAPTIDC